MQPSIGRIVRYTLSEQDAAAINKRRDDFSAYQRAAAKSGDPTAGTSGHIGHVGNHAAAGQVYPAVIVRIWDTAPEPGCNLQVLLDGNDTYWATSRHEGDGNGHWFWPPRA